MQFRSFIFWPEVLETVFMSPHQHSLKVERPKFALWSVSFRLRTLEAFGRSSPAGVEEGQAADAWKSRQSLLHLAWFLLQDFWVENILKSKGNQCDSVGNLSLDKKLSVAPHRSCKNIFVVVNGCVTWTDQRWLLGKGDLRRHKHPAGLSASQPKPSKLQEKSTPADRPPWSAKKSEHNWDQSPGQKIESFHETRQPKPQAFFFEVHAFQCFTVKAAETFRVREKWLQKMKQTFVDSWAGKKSAWLGKRELNWICTSVSWKRRG